MFPLDILLLLGGALGSPIEVSDYESGVLDGSTWDIVQSYEKAKARLLEDRLAGVTRRSPVGPGLMTESPLMAEGLVEPSGSGEESGSLGHPGHFLATDDLLPQDFTILQCEKAQDGELRFKDEHGVCVRESILLARFPGNQSRPAQKALYQLHDHAQTFLSFLDFHVADLGKYLLVSSLLLFLGVLACAPCCLGKYVKLIKNMVSGTISCLEWCCCDVKRDPRGRYTHQTELLVNLLKYKTILSFTADSIQFLGDP